jgi:lipoate-protein ligase A
MRLHDRSFDAPELNLAYDEVLLQRAEEDGIETLRFWESPRLFVVLGTGQRLAEHVNDAACLAAGVPILRRCTAGGCVVQGPGCLNFTLALTFDGHPKVRGLRASYCYILHALEDAFAGHGIEAKHRGICDLAVGPMKVSGNAQKRKRHAILHQGSLLYAMGPEPMAQFLLEPRDRPDYRGDRPHADFVGRLDQTAEELRAVVREAFAVEGPPVPPGNEELAAAAVLARTKYLDPAWTRRR